MYKILIVDDEAAICKGLSSCIDWAALDCEVMANAFSGQEALEIMAKQTPDILLTDINMAPINGIELIKAVGITYPNVKSILLTGIYDFDNAYNAIKFNVVDLVLKPMSSAKVIQAVRKAIEQIRQEEQQKHLQDQVHLQTEKNIRLKQAFLLSNLIEDETYTEDTEAALRKANLNLNCFFVVTILIRGIDSDNASGMSKAEESVYNYVDLVLEDVDYYCMFKRTRNIYIIINLEDSSSEAPKKACQLCLELNNMIDNLTDFYIAVGISNAHQQPSELYAAAVEAETASKFALYSDKNPVIEYGNIPEISMDTINDMKEYIDALMVAIEKLDIDSALSALARLNSFCVRQKLPFKEVRNIGLLVVNMCIRQLWSYGFIQEYISSSQESFYSRIDRCQTVQELQSCLEGTICSTMSNLLNKNEDPTNLVSNIENYIGTYFNQELSLENIASVFHISPGHLSRVFKARKNINLSNYIQQVRIEKSKALIISSNLRTYEIAEMVGINDPVYFSKLFKKHTSYRVRDYRAKFAKRQS
ncbi:MAG: response regulator transcription factor [Christensenellales bacterium]|jgi:two-component system response regulator YesN